MAVIDLIALICGHHKQATFSDIQYKDNSVQHVLVMDQGRYAIACDYPGELCKVNAANVYISNMNHEQCFYHGIDKSRLCPVINIDMVEKAIIAMPFVQSINKTSKQLYL